VCSKSCGFAAATQEFSGRACHRSRKMPNPPLHRTRPRLSFVGACRVSVWPVAVAAGPVSLIVRPSEPLVPQELRLRGRRWVPQELRFHGRWWCGCDPGGTVGRCGCRGRRAARPHQSCDFAAGAQELRLRGWWPELGSKSCGFAAPPQELSACARHRSRKMPNPPLHRTRPRLSFVGACRVSVWPVAVPAGPVSFIVRRQEDAQWTSGGDCSRPSK
jgi:hypothetical protein